MMWYCWTSIYRLAIVIKDCKFFVLGIYFLGFVFIVLGFFNIKLREFSENIDHQWDELYKEADMHFSTSRATYLLSRGTLFDVSSQIFPKPGHYWNAITAKIFKWRPSNTLSKRYLHCVFIHHSYIAIENICQSRYPDNKMSCECNCIYYDNSFILWKSKALCTRIKKNTSSW